MVQKGGRLEDMLCAVCQPICPVVGAPLSPPIYSWAPPLPSVRGPVQLDSEVKVQAVTTKLNFNKRIIVSCNHEWQIRCFVVNS